MTLRRLSLFTALTCFGFLATAFPGNAEEKSSATNAPAWISEPLSLAEAVNLALKQNGAILRGKAELEATYGVVVQTRAVALPNVRLTGNFTANDPNAVETFPSIGGPFTVNTPDQNWSSNIRILQSIYEGGRINSSLRAARLTREQALLQYQAVIADALLEVHVAYYDVLLAAQLITVQEASVNLLGKELSDTQNRFEAGTVPRFNVLRAEVEVANARPRLIRARNALRIAKNNLVSLIGSHVPQDVGEDIPLQLTGQLQAEPYDVQLPAALTAALAKRPELGVLRKAESLRKEGIVNAKSGYKPGVQVFAGYGFRNSSFSDDLTREVHGWNTGVQLSWDIFDGFRTKGRVQEARALYERAQVELDDISRRIEQEVRTAYSTFIESKEVLESQKKVQEQAEEALRLAVARNEAGTGTQLDVLSAQTALTEARATQVQALRDYSVARIRLERAIGQIFGPVK